MSKERLEDYLRIMSKFSSSIIRAREYRELGYGKFYLEELEFMESREHEGDTYAGIELSIKFKQGGYKDYTLLRKQYVQMGKNHTKEELYAQFYEEVLLMFVCCRPVNAAGVVMYCPSELINKGLPDSDKL